MAKKKTYAQKIHDWWLKQNRMIRKLQAEGYKGLELIPEPEYYESRKRNYENFRAKYSTKRIKENAYLPMINKGTGEIALKNWYEVRKADRKRIKIERERARREREQSYQQAGETGGEEDSSYAYEPLGETLFNNYMKMILYYDFNAHMKDLYERISNDPQVKQAIIDDLYGQSPFAKSLGGNFGLPELSFKGSYEDAEGYAGEIENYLSMIYNNEPVLDTAYNTMEADEYQEG